MHTVVVPLWSLLEVCLEGRGVDQEQAAQAAHLAIADAVNAEGALTIEVVDQRLVIDGDPVVHGVDTFAATQALTAFLSDACVRRVQFSFDVTVDALAMWGVHIVARSVLSTWPAGVEVTQLLSPESSQVVSPRLPPRPVVAGADSRLRSVFLQHRLIAGLPAIAGVDPMIAKLVVEGIVDRLLQVPGGLEPLMVLQQDEGLLRRSVEVAVLSVLFARRIGWSADSLADVGAAGLLFDLGAVLDASSPAETSFRWLLMRGEDDFWLRSALVARRWRDADAASADQEGPLSVVSVVRMAVAVQEAQEEGLDSLLASGAAPVELVQVARSMLFAG